MRPRNELVRDQLTRALARRAALSAPQLAEQLGISIAGLHRLLKENAARVLVSGKARRTRYALRQGLRGDASDLPLYEIDPAGRAGVVGHLALVQPQGSCLQIAEAGWPVPEEARDGWWDGLPYPLHDMRPQGYMGRQFARAEHHHLAVSANPSEWGDDDVVHVLSRSGSDTSGNLILGDAAFERWQATKLAPPEPIAPADIGPAYAALARQAVAAGVPGSSAAGEFPKFTALRDLAGAATPHVLVKFSGADDSATVRRWADLLICEHLALDSIASHLAGVTAANSRIVLHEGRCFLEVERFDRHGLFGRSRLSSLATLDAALLGDGSTDWTRLVGRFAALGLMKPEDVRAVQHLWWFGRLIANTDMHTGNLSFRPQGRLVLAPAYDMLPMLYAPLPGGELATRQFEAPLPLPPQQTAWETACAAALDFWRRAAQDQRISESFRALCADNAERLLGAAQSL